MQFHEEKNESDQSWLLDHEFLMAIVAANHRNRIGDWRNATFLLAQDTAAKVSSAAIEN